MPVVSLIKEDGLLAGAVIRDLETGSEHQVRARAVINATGVFSDGVRKLDEADAKSVVAASQGSHVVLPKAFLPGNSAIMVPHTPDGRVMFAVPWHDHVVVGTTDIGVDDVSLEPVPMDEEIGFILTNAAKYLTKAPSRSDVLSVYAGLRPLVKVGDAKSTAALSRDHTIHVDDSGLLTIAGGKWTTYRHMAEDCVDHAITLGRLDEKPCATRTLHIHGYREEIEDLGHLGVYGSDATEIKAIAALDASLAAPLDPSLPYIGAEVVWAAREEMARTVDDILSRRTRALFLNAKAAQRMIEPVAALLARELGRDDTWKREQIASASALAAMYVVPVNDNPN